MPWAADRDIPATPAGIPLKVKQGELIQEDSPEEQYGFDLLAARAAPAEQALAIWDRAIARNPSFAPSYIQKALALGRLDDADPTEVRRLLEHASSLGFVRHSLPESLTNTNVAGVNASVDTGGMLLDHTMLLLYCSPSDPWEARLMLWKSSEHGRRSPRWLAEALGACRTQVPPPAGR